jgi:hypothetical protein
MPYVSHSSDFGFYIRREASLPCGLLCVVNDAQCLRISKVTSLFFPFRLLYPSLFTLGICYFFLFVPLVLTFKPQFPNVHVHPNLLPTPGVVSKRDDYVMPRGAYWPRLSSDGYHHSIRHTP